MHESIVNGDSFTSSMRDPVKRKNFKSRSTLDVRLPPSTSSQYEEDFESKGEGEGGDEVIRVERNCSAWVNGCNKKRQVSQGDRQDDNANQSLKRNFTFNRLNDSGHKYMSRTHSSIDFSAALNNKNEAKFLKASFEEIKAKIALMTSQLVANDVTIKEYACEIKENKKNKEQIKLTLPNKISEKESLEEIYKSTLLKFGQSHSHKGQNMLTPKTNAHCNITVTKNEMTALSIGKFKEAVIDILNHLLVNQKYEIIYQNLIEAVISRTYSSIDSSRGDSFFLKLSKAICDIYPTTSIEALAVLLKYSVKISYIDAVIAEEMAYLSSDYKARKEELKDLLNKKSEENLLLKSQLTEMKEKEAECLSHLDLIVDISDKTTMNSSNIYKESIKKTSFLYEDEESEQSFGNKGQNSNISSSNYFSPHLLFQRRNSQKRIEDLNEANNTSKITLNNESNTFYQRASIAGSAILKNDSSFSIIGEDKSSLIIKTPIKGNKKHHRNKQLSFESQPPSVNANKSSLRPPHEINFSPSYIYSPHSQTQQGQPLHYNKRNKQHKEDFYNDNTHSFICQSNNDTGIKHDHYISMLNDTYCYFKILTKSDPKFNPLSLYSNTPELLGYDKGFISYDQSVETLLFASCLSKQRRHRIKLVSIQSLIVINLIKDIIAIHKSYYNMLQEFNQKSIDVDTFILRKEFNSIHLSNNDKIKAALCSFFSFSIVLSSNEKVELIFVSYHEFKVWYNSLGYLIISKRSEQ